jgi:D-3-phosphoglycerate dehydrogenase / 2-oxoglutarate reductase
MKVLITDPVHELMFERFEKLGFKVLYNPDISQEEVFHIISDFDGLIVNSKIQVNDLLIDKATKLRFVGRLGSGMEHINQTYLKEKGIGCFSSPEGNKDAVAEHVIGILLMMMNNLSRSNQEMKSSIWKREENRGIELMGRKIGIIGYGNTGKSLAKKLSGFDMDILVYDKYVTEIKEDYITPVSLENLLSEADIISFHIPLNDETKHILCKELLKKTKKQPIVVNASRGAIANTIDLIWALENNVISGLCIDVFEDEPIYKGKANPLSVYEQLLKYDNVFASPHIAGWTIESKRKLASILMDRIEGYLSSKD